MAVERLSVVLELISGQYKKEAREAATATGQIGNAARASTGGMAGLQRGMDFLKGAAVFAGASQIVGVLQDMGQAAAEDAESQAVLANALRTNVGATDQMIEANERWITSMQVATRTADTDLRQAITDLTVSGRSLEDAQKDIAIALDISASKGIALDSVIKGMVRSLASGSTAGLGRLGIETKNAAGEMLSYDEVLQNAAQTMGGAAATAANTLAGALERSKIIMEEAREEAGKNVVGPMAVLTGIWTEFQVAVLGGDEQLAELNTTFNLLISQGINPMTDQLASAITVLRQMNEVDLTPQTLNTLIAMLGLTETQVLELRGAILLSEDAFGMNSDAAARLGGLLDELVGNVDPAVLATRRHQAAMQAATGAATDYTEALAAQRSILREMADPFFALLGANERLIEANRSLNEIMASGDTTSTEYKGAIERLLRAQLEFNIAQVAVNETGEEAVGVFQSLAAQAGINESAFLSWAEAVDRVAGSIANLPSTVRGVNTITGNPDRPGAFHSGGVIPGPRGMERLAVVQAGEGIIPLDRMNGGMVLPGPSGMVSPSFGSFGSERVVTKYITGHTINVYSPTNNLPQDLQYATILASVTNLVEGR